MLTLFIPGLPFLFFVVGCVWTFSISARSADGKAVFAGVTLSLALFLVYVMWVLSW